MMDNSSDPSSRNSINLSKAVLSEDSVKCVLSEDSVNCVLSEDSVSTSRLKLLSRLKISDLRLKIKDSPAKIEDSFHAMDYGVHF